MTHGPTYDFGRKPEPGSTITVEFRPGASQSYTVLLVRPYHRKDGRWSSIVEVKSVCPKCGKPFIMTLGGLRGSVSRRRCGKCMKRST